MTRTLLYAAIGGLLSELSGMGPALRRAAQALWHAPDPSILAYEALLPWIGAPGLALLLTLCALGVIWVTLWVTVWVIIGALGLIGTLQDRWNR